MATNYYLSPRFLDKLSIHITKNYLPLTHLQVPLMLGIHGRKGEGKSFQCELVFKRMGVEPIHISASELESPDAGDPARLIRLRYREAAELTRVRGRMTVLMINDIDAGIGRLDAHTQYTVNTQLVSGTLMNIADNPTNVQLPGSYEVEPIQRIPIILTGNDFSTLYAPLIRDGRMEKFHWQPTPAERLGIVRGIFAHEPVSQEDVERLVSRYGDQAIDFYSALRSRLYDELVREFIGRVGLDQVSRQLVNSDSPPPALAPTHITFEQLVDIAQELVREQHQVKQNLAAEYQSQPTPGVLPTATPESNGSLSPAVRHQVQGILAQGQRLGIEHVDERRFRTQAWECCATINPGEASQAWELLEQCCREHPQAYVRLVGIEPGSRRRLTEVIVQRPAVHG